MVWDMRSILFPIREQKFLRGFVESLAKEKGRMKDYQTVFHG